MIFMKLSVKQKSIDASDLNASDYFTLDEKSKRAVCQKLRIYVPEHYSIFNRVDRMFYEKYTSIQDIEASQCGLAPILGPNNCIRVFIPRQRKKVILPKYFEGFPVIRIYEGSNSLYKTMVDRVKNKESA